MTDARPDHGWVWSVLPADCERIEVHGDPALARLLATAGRTVAVDAPANAVPQDAIVLAGPHPPASAELARLRTRMEPDEMLVVAIHPARGDIDRRPPTRRLRERLVQALSGARVARALRGARLSAASIETGPRYRAYELTPRRRWLPRPGRQQILIVGGRHRRTLAEEVTAVVAADLGTSLRTERRRVRASGVLMLDLVDSNGRRYLLRLTAGTGALLLSRSAAMQRALLGAGAPPAVRDRVAPVLASGTLRGVHYALEARLDGHAPRRLGARLMTESLDFLGALAATPTGEEGEATLLVADGIATLAPHLDLDRLAALERVGTALAARLAGTPCCWSHGDFWLGNLLVHRRRLTGVIDWDAANACGLPLSDAFHLIALGDRRMRREPHGPRCAKHLWPLARAGGDARLRECCARTGAPSDAATLEALAVAYWLTRVARDVGTFADRASRPTWMAVNVYAPLAALAGATL